MAIGKRIMEEIEGYYGKGRRVTFPIENESQQQE